MLNRCKQLVAIVLVFSFILGSTISSSAAECSHPNPEARCYAVDYEYIDENNHIAYMRNDLWCNDCWSILELDHELYPVVESHASRVDMSLCFCGYGFVYTTLEPTNITSTGATFHGMLVSNDTTDLVYPAAFSCYDYETSEHIVFEIGSVSSMQVGEIVSLTVTGLKPNTTYSCGFYVNEGYSAPREHQTFTTLPETKSNPTLENFHVTPSAGSIGTSFSVGGTVNGNGCTITDVSVGVRNASNEGLGGYWGHVSGLNVSSYDLSSMGALVAGSTIGNTTLEPGTYVVQAYVTTKEGLSFTQAYTTTITVTSGHVHSYVIDMDNPVYGSGHYVPVDTYGHKRISVVYKQYCSVCGEFGPDYTDTTEGEPQKHWYIDDDHYSYNEVGHWLTYLTCRGCEYVRADHWGEHTVSETYETVEYYEDINSHTVITTTYGVCSVCGQEWAIDLSSSIDGHVDQNNDAICDYCKGHCDISNTLYYDPHVQYIIYSEIEKYSMDKANISQSFLDNLQVHTDNIAFRDNTLYYGGIQHSPKFNEDAVMDILKKYGKLPSAMPQTSSIGETLAFLFGDYADEYATDEYLSLVNETGCFYTALSSTIFDIFEGRAAEFEEVFGFSMYYEGHLNYDAVLVDFYCYSEAQSKENAFGMIDSWKVTSWIEYAKSHGIDCHVPEINSQAEDISISASYIEECINNGDLIIIGLLGEYDLLDENGNSVWPSEGAGHAMVVTGIYKNYIVVSSWGHAYLLDIDTVNSSQLGVYTIQY